MDLIEELTIQAYEIYVSAKPYLSSFQDLLFSIERQIEPHINGFVQWASTSPSFLSVCFSVLLLFIIMQILNFVRRIIAFWLRLAVKISFIAVIIAIFAIFWQRGFERSIMDIESWCREVASVYWKEYERWEGHGSQSLNGENYRQRFGNVKYKQRWK